MIDFALEEWEWPQGAERRYAIGPFESDCLREAGLERIVVALVLLGGSRNRDALVQSLGQLAGKGLRPVPRHLCFFRPLGEPASPITLESNPSLPFSVALPSTNYVISYENALLTYDDFEKDARNKEGGFEASLRLRFSRELRPARYFNLPVGPCFVQPSRGVWEDGLNPTPFRVPSHWWQLPSAQLYAELVQAVTGEGAGAGNDAVAEVFYSYQHHHKSHQEIVAAVHQFAPAIEQRQLIMNAIAQLELRFDELLCWKVNALAPLDSGSQLTCHRRDATTWHPDLWERLCLWHQILQRTLPLPRLEDLSAPLCLLDAYRSQATHLHVYGEENSAHEQLEAGLFLREWVKDKATAEEFAILFPAG